MQQLFLQVIDVSVWNLSVELSMEFKLHKFFDIIQSNSAKTVAIQAFRNKCICLKRWKLHHEQSVDKLMKVIDPMIVI